MKRIDVTVFGGNLGLIDVDEYAHRLPSVLQQTYPGFRVAVDLQRSATGMCPGPRIENDETGDSPTQAEVQLVEQELLEQVQEQMSR